jgi:TonB family protein
MVKKIDVPVLFVYQPQLQSSAERLKKAMPSVRLELFEEAGHALFVDEAERFNRVVGEFLAAFSATEARQCINPAGNGWRGCGPPWRMQDVDTPPEPVFAPEPRFFDVSGVVVLSAIVDEHGSVQNPVIVRRVEPRADQKALETVREWRFRPALKDGNPVSVRMNIEVRFRLPE